MAEELARLRKVSHVMHTRLTRPGKVSPLLLQPPPATPAPASTYNQNQRMNFDIVSLRTLAANCETQALPNCWRSAGNASQHHPAAGSKRGLAGVWGLLYGRVLRLLRGSLSGCILLLLLLLLLLVVLVLVLLLLLLLLLLLVVLLLLLRLLLLLLDLVLLLYLWFVVAVAVAAK